MRGAESNKDGDVQPVRGPRVMLYSHDTFGLGHLRRSRALAQAITAADPAASALIRTGSPVAGRFDFPARVDHVRLPGVTQRHDGSYISQTLGMDIEGTAEVRAGLVSRRAHDAAAEQKAEAEDAGGAGGPARRVEMALRWRLAAKRLLAAGEASGGWPL